MKTDWIKLKKRTVNSPKILSIAASLAIHPLQALGLCVSYFAWIDDHDTGSSIGLSDLDPLFGAGFTNALVDNGWLTLGNGGLVVTDYESHLSSGAKQRALTKNRVKKSRCNANVTLTALHLPENLPKASIPRPTTELNDCLKSMWKAFPDSSRNRSSQRLFKKEWDKCPPSIRPTLEEVLVSIEQWKMTDKWKQGYCEGAHIWIKNQKWVDSPCVAGRSNDLSSLMGGRSLEITKITE